jgi:deoxyribose-phosphate aldolase
MLKNNDFERIIEESKMKIEELKLPIFEYKLSSMVDKSSDIKKPSELATFIEHTALKPETNVNEIVLLCNQAIKYKFLGVCVNPVYVPIAKKELRGTDCLVVTVISFPLGMSLTDIKVAEVEKTLSLGADEIDMVMSIGLLKKGI